VDGGRVHLTNLEKIFWPELGLTKRDLLQYYLDVSPWLVPHLKNRAMVMKRYPNGIPRTFFRDDDAGRIVTLAGERLCVSASDGST
jgi:bifunctional non-homologous end joining protein LigD